MTDARESSARPAPLAHSRLPRRTWSLAALLASLSTPRPFAIDAYLPAFPAIGREFGAGADRGPDAIRLPRVLRVH